MIQYYVFEGDKTEQQNLIQRRQSRRIREWNLSDDDKKKREDAHQIKSDDDGKNDDGSRVVLGCNQQTQEIKNYNIVSKKDSELITCLEGFRVLLCQLKKVIASYS